MSYKVIFQGGGAKLFPLLAAVEALQKHIKSGNNFSVDTVAGASAGSIAAMLVAADIDCDLLKTYFKTEEGKKSILSAFPSKSSMSVVSSILTGKTIFDRSKLDALLFKILELNGCKNKKEIVSLKTNLKIAITDLRKSKIEFIELSDCSTEELVRNVADSCSIPFIFKNHRTKANWEFVDGGLFENFPVSSVINSIEESRKILGFSFVEDNKLSQQKNPQLLQYMKILVSTAVDANIEASLRLLGSENVFSIKSDLSTLDFGKGLEQFVTLDSRLESLKDNIDVWIEGVVRREREIDATISADESSIIPTNFDKFKEAAGLLYQLRKSPSLIANYSVGYMQINSIFGDLSPNKSRFEYLYRKTIYQVPDEGVECILFGTSYQSAIDAEKYSDLSVEDEFGNDLEFLVLPVFVKEVPSEFINLGLFLSRRIFPSECSKLTVTQKQFIADCYLPLHNGGPARIEMWAPPEGSIERARMFVGLPEDTGNSYNLSVLSQNYGEAELIPNLIDGKAIEDASELKDIRSAGARVFGYEIQEKLSPGTAFVLDIERKPATEIPQSE